MYCVKENISYFFRAPKLVKLLTEEVEGVTGGKVALGDDPIEVAKNIEAHIVDKRKKMGLS
jgi:carbon-monoxide dehydrogenase catalytic subunit